MSSIVDTASGAPRPPAADRSPGRSELVFPGTVRWTAAGAGALVAGVIVAAATAVPGDRYAYVLVHAVAAAPFVTVGLLATHRVVVAGPAEYRPFWARWFVGAGLGALATVSALGAGLRRSPVLLAFDLVLILAAASVLTAACVHLAHIQQGRRALAVDLIDGAMAVLVLGVPSALIFAEPYLATRQPLLAAPFALWALFTPAIVYLALVNLARVPPGDRAASGIGVLLAAAASLNVTLQLARLLVDLHLPVAGFVAVHTANMYLAMLLPLWAHRWPTGGLERLPMERQIRRHNPMPYLAAVVLAGAGAGAFATRASQPWGVALVGVVAVAVCALNAVRYTTMHRETERLYAELGRMAEIRRQLLGSMVRTLDADRCRTLTELHAQAVSSLTSLATLARSAQAALPGEAARAFRQTAGDLQRDAERRAEELRRLVVALRPAVVPLGTAPMRPDQDGLADVLRAYAADLASGSAPAVHVRVASGLELDRATLAVAYRILQEALLRAVRRTRATTVTVAVAEEAGGVALEVRDDGMPSAGRYDGREWGKIRLLCELGRGHLTVQPDGAGGAGGTVMRAVLGGPTARGEASSDGGALPTTPRPRHLRLVRPVSDGAQGRGAGRSQPAGRGSEQSE